MTAQFTLIFLTQIQSYKVQVLYANKPCTKFERKILGRLEDIALCCGGCVWIWTSLKENLWARRPRRTRQPHTYQIGAKLVESKFTTILIDRRIVLGKLKQ
jgi:hypothetical protein